MTCKEIAVKLKIMKDRQIIFAKDFLIGLMCKAGQGWRYK
jgi:hypothetical protein